MSIKAKIGEKDLESVKSQHDLGPILQKNLSWNENCLSRSRKAMSALFQIKCNLSSSFDWKVKLNAYTGYVVPIPVYAFQTWLPSRSNLHDFEKVQHHATKWILNSNQSYRNRLLTLKLLPLSFYVEMHDLLLLLSIFRGDYDVVINDIEKAVETTRQIARGEYRITKARINKTDDNFF